MYRGHEHYKQGQHQTQEQQVNYNEELLQQPHQQVQPQQPGLQKVKDNEILAIINLSETWSTAATPKVKTAPATTAISG